MPTATAQTSKPRKAAKAHPRNRARKPRRGAKPAPAQRRSQRPRRNSHRAPTRKRSTPRARAHAPHTGPVHDPPGARPPRARPRTSFGDYAERAVLIPVGAALIARDRVVSGVSDTISTLLLEHQDPGSAAPLRAPRRHRPQPPRARGPQSPRARRARTAPAPPDDREDASTSSRTAASDANNGSEIANSVPEIATASRSGS